MKEIVAICPKCEYIMVYKNWFDWVLHTPFHWFNKRKTKCVRCGETSYIKGIGINWWN